MRGRFQVPGKNVKNDLFKQLVHMIQNFYIFVLLYLSKIVEYLLARPPFILVFFCKRVIRVFFFYKRAPENTLQYIHTYLFYFLVKKKKAGELDKI